MKLLSMAGEDWSSGAFGHPFLAANESDYGACWVPSVNPIDRSRFFSAAANQSKSTVDQPNLRSNWRMLFEPLFDPDVHLTEDAGVAIMFGMASRNHELKTLALDAFLTASDDGRLDVELTTRLISTVMTEGKFLRVQDALISIAMTSPVHATLMKEVLCTLVSRRHRNQSDVHQLLELMNLLLRDDVIELDDRHLLILESATTGNKKSDKTVKSLRTKLQSNRCVIFDSAVIQELDKRIERVIRWMGSSVRKDPSRLDAFNQVASEATGAL